MLRCTARTVSVAVSAIVAIFTATRCEGRPAAASADIEEPYNHRCGALQGPMFDTDARRPQGPVLRWVDRLLKAQQLGISQGAVPAVPKGTVGRTALLNLLRSNPEMFSVCVDRCYERDARIAAASFQVRRLTLQQMSGFGTHIIVHP